ncbi:uncharacterized protein G2W53_041982 [Senna tora]|uniref:Zinc finger PMZ-type domain-containing protein n=1 Tax=Senna tora TaxID=362788 RepID=A0A834SGK7_9FABA|nr:uncharacterized protein G2W53_041982 [Senna tora]
MEFFIVEVYYGRKLVGDPVCAYEGGQTARLENCDIDKWSYFEVVDCLKELEVVDFGGLWFKLPGHSLESLKPMEDDKDALTMAEFALATTSCMVELYVSGPIGSNIKVKVQRLPTAKDGTLGPPQFERLYICLDASIGRDPNDQMLPIAFAVVEAETKDSWSWFLSLLIEDIGVAASRDSVFGIYTTTSEKKFSGLHLKKMMWSATKATYQQEWERAMLEIKKVNESAYQHLKEIPPRFWTKSAFRPGPKCDQLLNNMCETFNAVILKAREKPIVTMLDDIKVYLMERWAKNRKDAEKLQSQAVLPKIQKRLDKEFQESGKSLPRWAGEKKYEVKGPNEKFAIDLSRRECGCRKWMLTGIPFAHAISCINHMGGKPENYIPSYYRTEHYKMCYVPVINPSDGPNLWPSTPYDDVLPPPYRKPIERPKKRRRKEDDEQTKKSITIDEQNKKANTNGEQIKKGGLSIDDNGNWVVGFAKFVGSGNAITAELWGIIIGMEAAKSVHCTKLIVETDNCDVISLINDLNLPRSHSLFPLVHKCRCSAKELMEVDFRDMYCEGNGVAVSCHEGKL